jgi:hypothetical protein
LQQLVPGKLGSEEAKRKGEKRRDKGIKIEKMEIVQTKKRIRIRGGCGKHCMNCHRYLWG